MISPPATPLLVIDGQNGPLDLGRIPMYRLPSVILRLLGEDRQTIFDLVQVPRSVIPRPLPDVMVTYQGNAPQQLCKQKTDFSSLRGGGGVARRCAAARPGSVRRRAARAETAGPAPTIEDGLHATLQR